MKTLRVSVKTNSYPQPLSSGTRKLEHILFCLLCYLDQITEGLFIGHTHHYQIECVDSSQ